MQSINSKSLSAFFLGIAIQSVALDANEQVVSEVMLEQQPITEWPAEPRPRMGIDFIEVQIDGPIEYRKLFDCAKFKLMMEDNGEWEKSSSRTPRYSVIMTDKDDPSLTFGISRFLESEFISDLSADEWNPYIEYLKTDVVPITITYQHYSKESRAAPMIPGNNFRQVDYEYALANEEVGKTREIFAFIEGELLVFIFSGTKEKIDSMRNSHNLMLSRMDLINGSLAKK